MTLALASRTGERIPVSRKFLISVFASAQDSSNARSLPGLTRKRFFNGRTNLTRENLGSFAIKVHVVAV